MRERKKKSSAGIQSITRLAWRLKDLSDATGLSVVTLRRAIHSDALRSFRVGRAVLVHDAEARRFLHVAEGTGRDGHD